MISSMEASFDKMFVESKLERSEKATEKPRKGCFQQRKQTIEKPCGRNQDCDRENKEAAVTGRQ